MPRKADLARAQQQAAQIQAPATAEAEKIRLLGAGEADRITALAVAEAERAARVGIAQAMATEEQVRAYGGPRYQLTQQVMARFAEAIEHAGVDVVPKIVIGGRDGRHGRDGTAEGGTGSGGPVGGSVFEALLTILLSERMGIDLVDGAAAPSAAASAVRADLQRRIAASTDEAA